MTREIKIGKVKIGGNNPVAVQSMTDTVTSDVEKTVRQIAELEKCGCDIVRVAILNESDAMAINQIKKHINIPIVADIHFDYRLAVASIKNGADKIRINPGNIGGEEKLAEITAVAKEYGVPIRIGVNGGSLDKEVESRFGHTPEALAESAVKYIKFFEKLNFFNLVISVKSSSVADMIAANRLLNAKTDYPLHIGVTESGLGNIALVKSSIGIGSLLIDDIGDTIRVSLTDNPVQEVLLGRDILRAVGKIKGCEVISCPTCGRCSFDLKGFAAEINEIVKDIKTPLKVAVMGCAVNGPGEARHADIGIAGGGGNAVIFKNGKILKTVKIENALDEFKKEIYKMAGK